ncbi:MAG: lipid II flippase MurJ [Myxococcota bacterium]
MSDAPPPAAAGSAASSIAVGILASRLLGLLREKALAYYFGVGPHLDVFTVAMRGANLLNNMLGEGTLSASFIPVYARMIEEGERRRPAGSLAPSSGCSPPPPPRSPCSASRSPGPIVAVFRRASQATPPPSPPARPRSSLPRSPSAPSASPCPSPCSWRCRRGRSACSTATGASSSPTSRQRW